MLQKSDAHALVAKDPFPFIWEVDGLPELKKFPVARLSDTSVLVVETHISSYAIPARGQSSGRNGYSALRAIYVASESDPGFAVNKFEMEFSRTLRFSVLYLFSSVDIRLKFNGFHQFLK